MYNSVIMDLSPKTQKSASYHFWLPRLHQECNVVIEW